MQRAIAALRTGISGFNSPQSIRGHATRTGYLQQQQQQQQRNYVPSPAAQVAVCWNCQKEGRHMICADCGSLQDVDTSINYFDLLNFPQKFSLQSQELTQRFRQLQARVHPDKYSNKTSREQTNSADWSSLINKAYKTLATPVERGQYMLQLEGEQMPQDNSALNTQFLMTMMERNEEVEEAEDSATLDALNSQLTKELEEKALKLTGHFEAKDLPAVKAILVEMKYLISIQSSIKKKQQHLMEAVTT